MLQLFAACVFQVQSGAQLASSGGLVFIKAKAHGCDKQWHGGSGALQKHKRNPLL